jgi:hypothetical protein
MSFFPTQGTQAPLVTRFKSLESEFRSWRHQVVTLLESEIQKILGDASANDMTSKILMVSLAATIPEKSSQWVIRAWHQFSAKYVEGWFAHENDLIGLHTWHKYRPCPWLHQVLAPSQQG